MLRAGTLAVALIGLATATSSCSLIRGGGAVGGRGVIVGRVMKLDSTALSGMRVTIDGMCVSTDGNGAFVMRQPRSSPQALVLSREGYKEFELPPLNLAAGDTILNPLMFLPPVPLVILDGVIQMQDDPSFTVRGGPPEPALETRVIRHIDVVMGPAAAALYGQRAGPGVINLRTR